MGCGASKKKQGAGDDGDLENVMTANRELDTTGSESAPPAKTPPPDATQKGGDNKDSVATAPPAQAKSGLVMDDGKAGPGCLASGSDDDFSESEAAPVVPARATPMPSYKADPSTLAADVVEARTFSLLHFNDVYHLAPSAKEPVGGAARFSYAVKSYKKAYGAELLFSGDCYNPSLMSTVTRGKHMLPILNELEIKCSVYGNHDFDFGIDVLKELTAGSNSNWLMSNVVDKDDEQPAADGLMSYTYTQPARGWRKETVKIGVVGVGEEEWLSCVRDLPANIVYRDAVAVARREAQRMRADEGCDVIIALTHMRHNNDVSFTRACPEVDIVLGGHDHFYRDEVLDTGQLLLKSGTDFKQLSHVAVKMPAKEGDRPTYTVERVDITSQFDEDPAVSAIVSGFEEKMREKIEKEICHLDTVLDIMTSTVRTRESAMGNLVADIMREHCRAECAMVNAGVLRAGVVYNPPTTLTIKDLLDIAPIEDVVVCVELTGEQIMGAVENGLSKWPQEEGRFLQVSGMQVVARTSSPGGSRVEALHINGAPLERTRTYSVATTAFLCKGCDGFDVLKGSKFLIDSENGSVLPTLIRQAIEGLTPTEVKVERRESVRSLQKAMGGKESFRYKQAAGVLRRAYLPTIAPQVEGRMVLLGEGETFNADDLNKTVPVGGAPAGSLGSRSPSGGSLLKDATREFPIPHGSVVRDPTRVQKAFAALQQRVPTGTVQWAPSMVALLGKEAEILNVTVPTVGMTKLRFLDTGECVWFPSEVVTMAADLRQGFSAGGAMTPPASGVRTPHGTPARFNSAIVRKASLISPRSVPNERTLSFIFRPVGTNDRVTKEEVDRRSRPAYEQQAPASVCKYVSTIDDEATEEGAKNPKPPVTPQQPTQQGEPKDLLKDVSGVIAVQEHESLLGGSSSQQLSRDATLSAVAWSAEDEELCVYLNDAVNQKAVNVLGDCPSRLPSMNLSFGLGPPEKRCYPVHYAAARGRISTLEILLQHGARLDVKSEGGFTPREVACSRLCVALYLQRTDVVLKMQRVLQYIDDRLELQEARKRAQDSAKDAM